MELEEYLTPEQVAEKLQVTRAFVYSLKNSKQLKALEISPKCIRFKLSDVNDFLEKKYK